MLTVLCKMDEEPKLVNVNNLYEMQGLVDGYIESIPLAGGLSIVCDEDGKLKGKEPNYGLFKDEKLVHVILGDFFIIGEGIDDFRGLTFEDIGRVYDIMNESSLHIHLRKIINMGGIDVDYCK